MKLRILTLQILALLAIPLLTQAGDTIQLCYAERAPYAVTQESGEVTGLTASSAAKAFRAAGISFKWKKMPFKRQLETVKYNKKKACGIGWFKNDERAEFALYTAPIYQDRPTVSISLADNDAVGSHATTGDLFKDKSIKLLIKDSFSYGTYIDALIAKHGPGKMVVVGSSNAQMLQAVLSGRADYFFISEEEASELLTDSRFNETDFKLGSYRDMPAGNNRYIACSKNVSQKIVNLLNKQLK